MEDVVPGSPSSLSSENSDSDAVNTSSARIYFGEFRTPEKKLAVLVDSTSAIQPTPNNISLPGPSTLRRSSRLSEPPEHGVLQREDESGQQGEQGEDEDEENRTNEGALQDPPFLEFLRKDEPSSALASRIMRAHDNPSPPPKALRSSLTPRSASRKVSGLVFPHISSSPEESSDAAVETLLQPRDDPTPPNMLDASLRRTVSTQQDASHSLEPYSLSNPSSSQTVQDDSEADLISFDRSVLISSPQGVELHSPSPKHAQQMSIDDLLFSSPQTIASKMDQQRGKQDGETMDLEALSLRERDPKEQEKGRLNLTRPSDVGGEHIEVKDSPRGPETSSQTPKRVAQIKVAEQEDQKTPIARLPVPNSSPSLRRSPRLSSLPQPSLQDTLCISTPSRTPKAKFPTSTGSQARKRRRNSAGKSSRKSLSPRKWRVQSEESSDETDSIQSPSKTRRDRKRVKKDAETLSEAVDTCMAASLSPGSADILSSLVSSVSSETMGPVPQANTELVALSTPKRQEPTNLTNGAEGNSPVKPSAPPISSSVQRPPPSMFNHFAITPSRGNAVKSRFAPNSPVKPTLTPASLDDPNRTPARRVPIKDAKTANAIQSTSVRQQTGVHPLTGFSRPPVFSRPPPPTDDPNRSPAKRVPVGELAERPPVLHRKDNGIASRSLLHANRSRTASAVTTDATPDGVENKPELNADTAVASSSKSTVVVPSTSSIPATEKSSTVPITSKSAPKVGSRIPRPGAISKPSSSQASKLPLPSAKRPGNLNTASHLSSPKKPLSQVARMQITSSSGSDDSSSSQTGTSRVRISRKALNSSLAKRKRDTEKPPPSRPIMKMRQVVPGMYGGPVKTAAPNKSSPTLEDQQPSPAKPAVQSRPFKAREVVKGTLQNFELRAASSKRVEALSEERAKELEELEKAKQQELEKARQQAQGDSSPPAPSMEAFTFECPVPEQGVERLDMETVASTTPSDSVPSSYAIENETAPKPGGMLSNESGARRSTRARRVPSDVFSTAPSAPVPAQGTSRRKSGTGLSKSRASSLPPDLIFSTNGVALKTLTNNNTARNQHYLAQLEMNIIRKPGNRPESPTMKLRTIVEKQKEDQDKMRSERVRRRRGEGYDLSGDASTEASCEVQPLRHRRGPGDEEDYETPVRPNDGRKAVKWDRGLEVSVFLDEIEVQPTRHRSADDATRPRKGCLIIAPNRAPLDGLGNPVNADAPLNVVPEKVVVTKFIYDNDEEAVLFDPPAPKATRSKSKKK